MTRNTLQPLPSLEAPAKVAKTRGQATSFRGPNAIEQRDLARRERDVVRDQRDVARHQRDEARRQRDEYRGKSDLLQARLLQRGRALGELTGDMSRGVKFIDTFAAEENRAALIEDIAERHNAGLTLSLRDTEMLGARMVPPFSRKPLARRTPPDTVAFLTVANAAFLPGLEALILSLVDVYPEIKSPIYICHDGTLGPFVRERLRGFYPNLLFIEPSMDWFDSVPKKSNNHKRIGKLGYMNMEAFLISGYDRIIILDSDIIVTDDIHELWQGDEFLVCYDCGDREYVTRSEVTKDWVFNSGVISIPGRMCSAEHYKEFRDLIQESAAVEICPALDRFSDQKIWNLFLRDKPKRYLPINYNCNVKYLAQFLGGQTAGVSIIHFAGPKPWNNKTYVPSSHIQETNTASIEYPRPWINTYGRLMYKVRHDAYARYSGSRRSRPVRAERAPEAGTPRTCLMIGNGPSLARTNLECASNVEKFAFNWYVLSDDFDTVRPEHLILGSHMLFGGWATTDPRFPDGFLEKLRSRQHKPVLWLSFYFKEYIESIMLHEEYEINYCLFEKPFKRFVDCVGRYEGDIDGFLDDARTGVLSLAVPVAISLGFERILLVGCDSNYNQPGIASRYFYDTNYHTSAETNESSLTSTWTETGRGQFVYKLVGEELARRGIEFFDCTIGGALRSVAKGELESLVAGQ